MELLVKFFLTFNALCAWLGPYLLGLVVAGGVVMLCVLPAPKRDDL